MLTPTLHRARSRPMPLRLDSVLRVYAKPAHRSPIGLEPRGGKSNIFATACCRAVDGNAAEVDKAGRRGSDDDAKFRFDFAVCVGITRQKGFPKTKINGRESGTLYE